MSLRPSARVKAPERWLVVSATTRLVLIWRSAPVLLWPEVYLWSRFLLLCQSATLLCSLVLLRLDLLRSGFVVESWRGSAGLGEACCGAWGAWVACSALRDGVIVWDPLGLAEVSAIIQLSRVCLDGLVSLTTSWSGLTVSAYSYGIGSGYGGPCFSAWGVYLLLREASIRFLSSISRFYAA